MSNKETSVDWQFDQLSTENLLGLFTHDQMQRAMEILEEAKAMHKQEIEKVWIDAYTANMKAPTRDNFILWAEEYYNKTFK